MPDAGPGTTGGLTALAFLSTSRERLGTVAQRLLDELPGDLPPDATAELTITPVGPSRSRAPKHRRGTVRKLLSGQPRALLAEALREAREVRLVVTHSAPGDLARPLVALEITAGDARTPAQALAFAATCPDMPAIASRWEHTLDDVMRSPDGLQATLSPTAHRPSLPPSRSSFAAPSSPTFHESERGVEPCGDLLPWTSRWLRWPGQSHLWLGPSLAAHLDRSALAPIADVVPCGDGLHLTLRRPGDAPAFAQALTPLLPTADDARRAHEAWINAPPRFMLVQQPRRPRKAKG